MADGTAYRRAKEHAKGDPEAPMSRDEIIAKAERSLAMGAVDKPELVIAAVIDMAADGPVPDLPIR
jgi:hypothetical protein